MSRTLFNQSLAELQDSIVSQAECVEKALLRSVELFKQRDLQGSQILINEDRKIDEKRYAIEAEVMTLIATQAPIAGQMRMLASSLFIVNELERIADYAKGIAKINLRIGQDRLITPLVNIPRMGELARHMLRQSMQAYAQQDVSLARAIIPQDDQVDALYDQVYADLITLIIQDATRLRQANLLTMAAHNLERSADRVTNICERVIFMVTGELVDSGWKDDID